MTEPNNTIASSVLDEIRRANEERDAKVEAARERARDVRGTINRRIDELRSQLTQLDNALGESHKVERVNGTRRQSSHKENAEAVERMLSFLQSNVSQEYPVKRLVESFFSHVSYSSGSQKLCKLHKAGVIQRGHRNGTYCYPLRGGI